MNGSNQSSDEMLKILDRYANGRIPPLISIDGFEDGLINNKLLDIYKTGFQRKVSDTIEIQLIEDQGGLSAKKETNIVLSSFRNIGQSLNPFCMALRGRTGGEEACLNCDRKWANKAISENCVVMYMCDHGLIEFAVPIYVNDIPSAVVFAGRLYPAKGDNWYEKLFESYGVLNNIAELSSMGVDARAESEKRVSLTEQNLNLSKGTLSDFLYQNPDYEISQSNAEEIIQRLDLLREHFSQLASAKLEIETNKIRSWLISGISHSLTHLESKTSTNFADPDSVSVLNTSVNAVWDELAKYLAHTCKYFGFAHLAVLSVDSQNSGNTINLLSYAGQKEKDFPFPSQYDCSKFHIDLLNLATEMTKWRTVTNVDLMNFTNLPVIGPLYNALRRCRPITVYAISGHFIAGAPPILILAGIDCRKRNKDLSNIELEGFMSIAQEIGLVTNICSFVAKLDDERKRQARFIEDVAHDIRNPIQNLISMVDFIQIGNLPVESKQKIAKDMSAEVKRINDLSQRVWVLEEIRRGIFDPQARRAVAVYEILAKCRKSLLHRSSRNQLAIEIDKELQDWPNLKVNEDLFFHTVLNLMDNAVKYSLNDTEIRISGFLSPTEAIITFGNIGIGIPENEKELIFERYHRTRNAELKVREGTGIGLSIVKTFADLYGSIEVESTPHGKGDRFLTIFRLKIRRE